MHFFYIDESGCTGPDLNNNQQPIFVLGGISVRDEGWRATNEKFNSILVRYFDGNLPPRFELHSHQLLNSEGFFEGHDRERVNQLVNDILDLVTERSHAVHFIAIDKVKMRERLDQGAVDHAVFRAEIPYLLSFNYLVSYIERYTKEILGRSARGMIILDIKDGYQGDINSITHFRRYEIAKARRLKWLVEFSYPVDSARHPMIQISDLVIFLIRKFLEIDNGYKPNANPLAIEFYARCFERIVSRVKWSNIINIEAPEERAAHELLVVAQSKHRTRWRQHYDLGN